MEKFTFTVGKLDAGMAILIGERAHLIEFPSILLPPGVSSGSIVNISVNRNQAAEKAHLSEFWALQDQILNEYGIDTPKAPELRLRHVTQTSATLEWPQLELAKADLRALEIYKNGQRLALIPNPKSNTSTKLSSLQSNEEYTFQLVLKTTAGVYPSNVIKVRTHTMNDTSGISVCFGSVQDDNLVAHAKAALKQMNAKWTETLEIDTTHFVCQSAGPAENNYRQAHAGICRQSTSADRIHVSPSAEYQKAIQLSLPIVQPQWVLACLIEKKLVPVSAFQLGTTTPAQYQPRGDAPEEYRKRPHTREEMTAVPPSQPTKPGSEMQAGQNHDQSQNSNEALTNNPASGSKREEPMTDINAPATTSGSSQAHEATVQQADTTADVVTEVRAKSPKPEADGKLDRGFKFPSSSPPPDEQATVSGDVTVDDNATGGIAGHEVPSSAKEAENEETADAPSETREREAPAMTSEPVHDAPSETTRAQDAPPRPESKKTDPDVDVAARQWLSGQKHVDDTGDSASQHSARILDQVLNQKAAKAADVEPETKFDDVADQEANHTEAEPVTEKPPVEASLAVESAPVVEVEKDEGEAVKVDEPETPEPNVESGIEVQKDQVEAVPISSENAAETLKLGEAAPMQQQEAEGEGAEEANDDEDETPADSAAQTPAGSPIIPDVAAAATGGKKKKNKRKNKK